MGATQEENFTVTRITRYIPKSFDQVMERLKSSIKIQASPGTDILKSTDSKEAFIAATHEYLGPHDFMHFAELNHGAWTSLFGFHKGLQAKRIIFGNPFIAITMLEHDMRAGLFAPVEALVLEREDGHGTDVIMIKPSTIIAGGVDGERGKALGDAAEKLDKKLEDLWQWVASEE